MKLRKQLSKVRFELECTPDEIARCKAGEYVEDANGSKFIIWSVNADASTIEVGMTVSESFTLPSNLGRRPGA